MKALLLVPGSYSTQSTVSKGFRENGIDPVVLNYETFFAGYINKFVNRFEPLPNKLKRHWKKPYEQKLNQEYRNLFDQHQPEYVFIYNNQLIHPDTISHFRNRSKVIFFLGDNPLYTPTSEYNLPILFHADYILCPDTFWIRQLEPLGIRNLHFGTFGYNDELYFPFTPSAEQRSKYTCDLVYVGTGQKNNWGYKRFLYLNQFGKLNMKAYITGDGYQTKWRTFFPNLEKRIIPYNDFNQSFNNLLNNCAKVYPIDLVPSLFNGIHIRIMDCIGSGILPLPEYSSDLDLVFSKVLLPSVRHYADAEKTALHYIERDQERENIVKELREFVHDQFSPKMVINRILTAIN